MGKKTLYLLFFLVLPTFVWAEGKEDSLKVNVDNASTLVEQLEAHHELAAYYLKKYEFKKAEPQLLVADSLLVGYADIETKARHFFLVGKLHYYTSRFETALSSTDSAILLYEQLELLSDVANARLQKGNIYYFKGDNLQAIEAYRNAALFYEENKDTLGWSNCLTNIAMLLDRQKNFDLALEQLEYSLTLKQSIQDSIGVAKTYLTMGLVNVRKGEFDEAHAHYEQSLALMKALKNDLGIARVLNNMGVVNRNQGNLDEALKNYQESTKIKRKINDLVGLITSYSTIGNIYFERGDYRTTILYHDTAIALADSIRAFPKLEVSYKAQASCYARLGEYYEAYEMHKKLMVVKDSLYERNRSKDFQNLLVKYESEKQEHQIVQLNSENDQKALVIEKDKLRQNWLIGSIIGLFAFAGLIVYAVWQKMSARKKLAEQASKLAHQQLIEQEKNHKIEAMNAIVEGQEVERERVARELHDSLGSLLGTASMQFDALKKQQGESETEFERTSTLLSEACTEVRRISHAMMPEALKKFGLIAAIQDLVDHFNASGSIHVDFQAYAMNNRLDSNTEITLYRIVQELLSNINKHAKATEILIQLNRTEHTLNLMVEDDGVGFDVEAARAKGGMGMKNLESRISYLEGQLSIDSELGKGTTVMVDIPLRSS